MRLIVVEIVFLLFCVYLIVLRGFIMPKNYICDMDGVLVFGSQVIPGANDFIRRLQEAGSKFQMCIRDRHRAVWSDYSWRLGTR